MKKITLCAGFMLLGVFLSFGQYTWTYDNLSEPKGAMGSVSYGNKAYFAGGYNETGYLTQVEIYDLVSGTWDPPQDLSVPRQYIVGASCGNKIFFAGGMDWAANVSFNTVDIYDTETNKWTVEHLSSPRFDFAAASHGNQVLFAGGADFPFVVTDVVDVYDMQFNSFSIAAPLSQPRSGITSAVVGDLALFAGGMLGDLTPTDRVDIFNFTTETWSIATLSQARAWASATTLGDKVFIGGGISSVGIPSDQVDIYDHETGLWTITTLSESRGSMGNAATVDGKAFFAGGGNWNYGFYEPSYIVDRFDDTIPPSSSTDFLAESLIDHSVVGVISGLGGYLVVAGGKNEWNNLTSLVEICTIGVGIGSEPVVESVSHVYPNPFSHCTMIEYELKSSGLVTLSLFNHFGEQVAVLKNEIQQEGKYQVRWNAENMPAGIYFYLIRAGKEVGGGKVIKQ